MPKQIVEIPDAIWLKMQAIKIKEKKDLKDQIQEALKVYVKQNR